MRKTPAALALLSMAFAATPAAAAEEPDTLTLQAGETLRYDSNLFRRGGRAARSETLSTTVLGAQFDKRYSLQRIELDADVQANRYRANDYLNFNALNYRAVWHWSLTPRLTGTLARTRAEDINTFDYYRSFDRNVRTDTATRARADYALGRDWALLGGLDREESSNERPTSQQGDYTLNNFSLGVRRSFPSGSSIAYRLMDGRGDYQNRVPGVSESPTSFDQREHELQLSWSASSKTTLEARVAHLQRQHPGFAVRDFSGMVGNLSLKWNATAKLGLQLTMARELAAYQTNAASYATNNRLSLYPYLSIGPRTQLSVGYDHSRYAFGGAPPGAPVEDRRDRTNTGGIGVRWQPVDALALSARLAREHRSSNLEGFGYTNDVVRVDARLSF